MRYVTYCHEVVLDKNLTDLLVRHRGPRAKRMPESEDVWHFLARNVACSQNSLNRDK